MNNSEKNIHQRSSRYMCALMGLAATTAYVYHRIFQIGTGYRHVL